MIKFAGIPLVFFLASIAAATSVANAQSCNACNCQFNNVQVLKQIVKSEVDRILADEPYVRLLRFHMSGNRVLKLQINNHTTLNPYEAPLLANITISDSSQPVKSPNNLLAYLPRFPDAHRSNLAGVFINLEGVFPCLQSVTNYGPICHTLTEEEDGFRNGKAFIDAADVNTFRIFSSTNNTMTYGIAIQNCPEFTTSCFPIYFSFSVACYLPRAACS